MSSMADLMQFIRARRAGHTTEAMLQQRIRGHQEELALRAQQAAGRILEQIDRDRGAAESLNRMVEEARPTQQAEEQLAHLKQNAAQLRSVREAMEKDLKQVTSSLEEQEKRKASAHDHLTLLRAALAKRKKPSEPLAIFYQVGTKASERIVERLDPN